VAYDSAKGEIFAASGNAKVVGSTPSITVISDSNNSVVATITYSSPGNSAYDWPNQPMGVVYDSAKSEVFVSDVGAYGGSVYVISDSSNSVVATVAVGHNPGDMAYDSAKGEVFVANTGSSYISVISDATNKVVANVSSAASSLVYVPDQGEVFALGGSTVSVISDSSNQVVATVSGNVSPSTTMAYDSALREVFAGAVISTATNSAVAQLPANIGNLVYDSGKGEIVGTASAGLDLFSDSSGPSTTSSSTSTSASGSTATGGSKSSSTTSATPTTASGGGGVPEFPYGPLAAAAVTALLVLSYVLVRFRANPRATKEMGRVAR